MTIAKDAFTVDTVTSGNNSFTHTPTGTPDGVLIGIVIRASAYSITAVTYGGVACTEVTNSPQERAIGETGEAAFYSLDSGVPSGAQTVAVTYSDTGFNRTVGCWTVTAGGNDIVEVDTSGGNGNGDVGAIDTLALGGDTCFVCESFFSGESAATGVSPLTGWTDLDEYDWGSQVGAHYEYDTIGSTNVDIGWDQTNDDYAYVAVAFKETGGGGGTTIPVLMNSYRQRHQQMSFG